MGPTDSRVIPKNEQFEPYPFDLQPTFGKDNVSKNRFQPHLPISAP